MFYNREQLIAHGVTEEVQKKRRDLLDIFTAALESVNPYYTVKNCFNHNTIKLGAKEIEQKKYQNIYVVGFGKASAGMTQAVLDSVPIKKGVIITHDSEARVIGEQISVIVGGHPIPDNGSVQGAQKILELVTQCTSKDLLIVLISGGGSALFCNPRVPLADLQKTTDMLLKSGADIKEINTIRKHLSYVKGGQLAALAGCPVIALIISDVVNDPVEFIASGPTSPDSTMFSDSQKVFEKYALWKQLPETVVQVITQGVQGKISDTPKKDNPVFEKVSTYIVANNKKACSTAMQKAELLGYKPIFLTSTLTGEAKDIGRYLVEKAKAYTGNQEKTLFVSGGETTVTIHGSGRGGRNQEMVLATVDELRDTKVVFASLATDGRDGTSDAAGAIADGYTVCRSEKLKVDPEEYLKDNDSYSFFTTLDDCLLTGPTGTNVMDLQLIAC